ncbi:MAG: c-type cytochrome [Pyrinomonadaceae bacterium]
MNSLKLAVTLFAVAMFIAACSQTAVPPVTNNAAAKTIRAGAPTATPAAVDEAAMAKELYATNCMICHKDSGKGGKVTIEGKTIKADDLTSDKMKNKSDDKLNGSISEGFPDDGMPAFKGKLTPYEIKAVVKHVRSLQGT